MTARRLDTRRSTGYSLPTVEPAVGIEQLVRILDVAPDGSGRFRGRTLAVPMPWIYGGQFIGQAIAATAATAADRELRSIHLTFVSPGITTEPVDYEIETIADRRSFAVRRVTARQLGEVRVTGTALLHHPGEGPDHQFAMPEVAPPDTSPPADRISSWPLSPRVASGPGLFDAETGPAEQAFWFRADDTAPIPEHLHGALLGFASDLTILAPVFRPIEGIAYGSIDIVSGTTLTHNVVFHRSVRMDDWVLFAATSPRAHAGRALASGHWFTTDGSLVASCQQEAMTRWVR